MPYPSSVDPAMFGTYTVNVRDYGALGNGSGDDTNAINSAMSAVNAIGGGIVFFPAGTFIAGTVTLYSKVHIIGSGIEATIIKLKTSANADLLSASTGSINLSASLGSSSSGGIYNWSLQNLTLDGNNANQSSGTSYCLRAYAYGYILQNVRIRNGYTGGVLLDWNGGTTSPGQDSMEAQFSNLKVHDNNGIGIQFGGPHDSQFVNVCSFSNGAHGIHLAPNAQNQRFANCRSYNPATGKVAWLIEANGCSFANCEGSGSDATQVALIASNLSWTGGRIYANPAGNVVGLQLGQPSGQTPISGQINQSGGSTTAIQCSNTLIETSITDCQSGAINLWNEANNSIIAKINQSSGTALVSSRTPAVSDLCVFNIGGLTPDGSLNTSSSFWFGGDSNGLFRFYKLDSTDVFTVDSVNKNTSFPNSGALTGYFDNYSSQAWQLQGWTGNIVLAGNVSTGQSASAAAIANNGTITTADMGATRAAPTGNVTGIILQSGTQAGQQCTVINESAFTVTFAAVGTSHVADGVSAVIAANRCMMFAWDSSTSKWYHS